MDKDSQDVHQVLNELKNKFQEMRKLISSMPGIGVSPEQQQQQLPGPMDKDSQDVHQVLNELKNKFQEMRKLISSMPGIGVSPEQQQQQLQSLREQVRTKNELLQKYKSLCMFEIPKE
ncbi:PREDICTED: mediator of RNA polymerase II transcription subunit 9 [Chaetura pelagica]|uniref:mediator of RNA polymerase II transcription subunit 9 n=1 Tax=Chaetura pelagica TaxID=8897 RepID=UPI0005233DD7|nr:PREDICTED: mediator of RNA polymerase II transcription subunit 9 [Chaetura pelagica]